MVGMRDEDTRGHPKPSSDSPAPDRRAGPVLASAGQYPPCKWLDQRQKDQDDPERSDVPNKGAQQKNARCVQGEISDATPKIELNAQFRQPTVCGCNMCCQDGRSKQRKRLDEILQRPLQPARHSG